MQKFVNFPTRGDNILDHIISDLKVTAKQLPHLGTSDHCNILASIDVSTRMPEPPPGRKVYHWKTASSSRINGALKLALKHWKASVTRCLPCLFVGFSRRFLIYVFGRAIGKKVEFLQFGRGIPSPIPRIIDQLQSLTISCRFLCLIANLDQERLRHWWLFHCSFNQATYGTEIKAWGFWGHYLPVVTNLHDWFHGFREVKTFSFYNHLFTTSSFK